MAIELFQPKRADGRAYWRVLYQHIDERLLAGKVKVGDLLTHWELRDLLDDDAQGQYGAAINRCAQELREEHDGLSLMAVRGQGYRLIIGISTADQGASYKRKGQRALRRGIKILDSVNPATLSAGERSVWHQMQRNMTLLEGAVGRSFEELDRHSEQLSVLARQRVQDRTELKGDVADVQDQLDELKRQLDELRQDSQG